MNVVVNTSPLVALDRIGRLEILPKLFGEVIRPQSVALGLNVTGTLGVLLAAHTKGILTDIEKTVSALSESGFRISDKMVRSVLSRLR